MRRPVKYDIVGTLEALAVVARHYDNDKTASAVMSGHSDAIKDARRLLSELLEAASQPWYE